MIAEGSRLSSLKAVAAERGIKHFLISFTDLFGTARAKLVPAAAIADMSKAGAAFAGFATWLDLTPADPDMLAVPDPTSLMQLPWKPEVGWLAADAWMNGKRLEQAPRNVLKRTVEAAAALGFGLKTGVECEFFLTTADGTAISDSADRQIKPCYDQSALMRRYDVIAELSDAMDLLGWQPYQSDHEDANGQFEMNWLYDDALVTADRHAFFKYMVKVIAEKHGLRATFMPKPFVHSTGNGAHMHASLWRDGNNAFEDETGELGVSKIGYHFIGGIIANARALCALLNPTVNSYKRINAPATRSGATWSPNTMTYSGNNRTHMIRIPESGRFELRLPRWSGERLSHAGRDSRCGPRRYRQLPRSRQALRYQHVYRRSRPRRSAQAPYNLLDALRALDGSSVLRERLGDAFVNSYLKLRHADGTRTPVISASGSSKRRWTADRRHAAPVAISKNITAHAP